MTSRRQVLGGVMGVMYPHPARGRVAGGNPPLRPDQAAQLSQTQAGSGPAPQSQFIIAQRVVVFGTGPGRGVFVYSPIPGAGNLVASIAASSGTDPFGNAYLPGESSYGSGVASSIENGELALFTGPVGGAGPWTVRTTLATTPAQTSFLAATGSMNLQIGSWATVVIGTGASTTNALLEVHGSVVANGGIWALAATASGTPPTGAEVFNDLGSTGLAGDTGTASYRLTAEGELQITIQKTFTALGGVTTATFATTLVAPYIPPAARILVGDPIKVNGGSPGSTTGLHLTTGGAVQLTGLPAGATGAGCDVRIPLF